MKIKYICTINYPKKGEDISVFSLPSGINKNLKLNNNYFDTDETELLFPWFEKINKEFGINITHTNSTILASDMVEKAEESLRRFEKEINPDKKLYKKILSILKDANKKSVPVEISCWYAPEFQHFITVPSDKESMQKIDEGIEINLKCKDWVLHEDQVEYLMDNVLSDFNEKFEMHIDLYEDDFVPSDKVRDCISLLLNKNPSFNVESEKEAWTALTDSLEYAESVNTPVYFFF